jgi:hypothetical protein
MQCRRVPIEQNFLFKKAKQLYLAYFTFLIKGLVSLKFNGHPKKGKTISMIGKTSI